ncbi:Calcineurin-like phosphoesterase [Hartmannibacter diazotrophicus]|uniref:Calcineurin-like phosphoesterase n=1 Tax=Hartmannibacter diazotrophicus TaxID=1482074 RepID=A0A2C9D8J7_9HYPH|nr:metallophosphoesterase [Hartmannibacter diazotrophicus]SON56563.1 Calcineurin-like phosphoesterase [Hartmannibacter diazotrophicus]
MFRLAHLSDPHIGPIPAPTFSELASKRVLGYINWKRNRATSLRGDILLRLIAEIHARTPDHIAVTGDLVNIALKSELEPARAFLESLGPSYDVSVVPGNHDAYVPGALARATEAWAPYMCGDGERKPMWPYVRRRGDVAIIGTSSARASAPFLATGTFSDRQQHGLEEALNQLRKEGLFRIILIHHPPFQRATTWHKRLIGASRVRQAIRRCGAELVLHGHTHLPTRMTIEGRDGAVDVVGVSAASQEPGGHKPPSGYNLFEIERRGNEGWNLQHTEWRFSARTGTFEDLAIHTTKIARQFAPD